MNNLFENKYVDACFDVNSLLLAADEKPTGKYGFIAFENPRYLQEISDSTGYTCRDERKYIYRKPNAKERREIVINTIIESCGRPFSIPKLAKLLAVSDRTLQSLLKSLKEEGLISVTKRYAKNGARRSNSYRYTGTPCKYYGSGLNLRILYDLEQNVGFRNWAWYSMSFLHDKTWYDIYDICKLKFQTRMARAEFLKQKGLPLTVPEDVNYLVLRYSYWKGHNAVIYSLDVEYPEKSYQYSRDGTIKVALNTGDRSKKIRFYEYEFELVFSGSRDNPKVDICEHGEKLATFTWFTENVIQRMKDIDEEHTEQFFILGDFTAK